MVTDNSDVKAIVRRLTERECERLQGFEDDWTSIPPKETMSEEEVEFWDTVFREHARIGGKSYKPPKDKEGMVKRYNKMVSSSSNRYKSLGNSLALPQWWWITCKMANYLPEGATLGSLFDGIGGFPCVWEERHGKGTAKWASEVEPFPIAVTIHHFGGKEE